MRSIYCARCKTITAHKCVGEQYGGDGEWYQCKICELRVMPDPPRDAESDSRLTDEDFMKKEPETGGENDMAKLQAAHSEEPDSGRDERVEEIKRRYARETEEGVEIVHVLLADETLDDIDFLLARLTALDDRCGDLRDRLFESAREQNRLVGAIVRLMEKHGIEGEAAERELLDAVVEADVLPGDLRTAIVILIEQNVGDYIYAVREKEGEGWDGERVKAWSDACQVLQKYHELSKERRPGSSSGYAKESLQRTKDGEVLE